MRLKSEIWIKSYLRRCQVNDVPAFVTRRGQADGGAIYIIINRLNGEVDLYIPAPAGLDAGQGRLWSPYATDAVLSSADADDYLARQSGFDPDIWVVEVEDRQGRHFLAEDLVSE